MRRKKNRPVLPVAIDLLVEELRALEVKPVYRLVQQKQPGAQRKDGNRKYLI